MGRYYAATYVILDAVNRARDAAAVTAAASGAPGAAHADTSAPVGTSEPSLIDSSHLIQDEENDLDGGGSDGSTGGEGGRGYGDMGSGGLGVIVVSHDGKSLDTTGEHIGGYAAAAVSEQKKRQKQMPRQREPQRKQQQVKKQKQEQRQPQERRQRREQQREQRHESKKRPRPRQPEEQNEEQPHQQELPQELPQSQQETSQQDKRAHPDTGGMLKRGEGWSESRESFAEEEIDSGNDAEDVPSNRLDDEEVDAEVSFLDPPAKACVFSRSLLSSLRT